MRVISHQGRGATKGTTKMADVCKKVLLGKFGSIPEVKVVWKHRIPKFMHRTSHIHVYLEACAPSNVMNQILNDVTSCALSSGAAAGIAAIASGPGALPVFTASFKSCLEHKVGQQLANQVHVAISSKQEAGPWH
jgi:hypothetical protein